MELTKKDTKMIQGVSVVAMLLLHLFCRYNYEELYTTNVVIMGYPLAFYFGQLADFCVMGFAFCSGYSHWVLYSVQNPKVFYQKRLKSLAYLYLNFWVILFLFVIVGFAFGKQEYIPGNLKQFVLTFTSVNVAYNGAWWYLFIYALIVVISPISLKLSKRINTWFLLALGFGLYLAAYYVRFHTPGHGWLLEKFGTFGMTYFEYLIGVSFAKEELFTKGGGIFLKLPNYARAICSILIFLAMLFVRTQFARTLIVAPVTGIVIIALFHFWRKPEFVAKVFLFVGNHSTNIWLTHMFYLAGLFPLLVYKAKYPILIFAFLLLLSIATSYVVNVIYNPLRKGVMKIEKKCSNCNRES